jgi:hypothetical protein
MNISKSVSGIVADGLDGYLELVVGETNLAPLKFNQRETLRRINFYLASKYTDRDDDALFWNLSNSRITHFAKNIDLDTKDFLPYGEGEYNFFQAWALRKKFREWCRDNSFYLTLNDISEGLATYGSIVWKKEKVKGKTILKEVKLDNLYFDQSIENIRDTNIVEKHFLSAQDLEDKRDVWKNIDEAIKKIKGINRLEVWEYWGWYNEEGKSEYAHQIGCGYGDDYINLWEEKTKKDECPYFDFHLGRFRGRWLRVGVVERLFELQVSINKLVNWNEQASEIASLLLLKSTDPDFSGGNILTQAENGQVFSSSDLQQIAIDNRGLASFLQQMALIEAHADKLCLTPDIVQGEQSPSGTPFRTVAVVNANSKSAFTVYKQNLGEGIAKILLDEILPSIVKSWSKDEFIEMEEDDKDVEMYDQTALDMMLIDYKEKSGLDPTTEIEEKFKKDIANETKKNGRRVIPDFNFKWGIRITPTSESVDKQTQNDAMFNALQIQGQNPAAVDTPLFRQYLENNGISYWKLTPKQQANLQAQATGQNPQPKQPDALAAKALNQ